MESFDSFVNSFNAIMARVFQAPDGPDERGDEGFGGSLRRRGLVDSTFVSHLSSAEKEGETRRLNERHAELLQSKSQNKDYVLYQSSVAW